MKFSRNTVRFQSIWFCEQTSWGCLLENCLSSIRLFSVNFRFVDEVTKKPLSLELHDVTLTILWTLLSLFLLNFYCQKYWLSHSPAYRIRAMVEHITERNVPVIHGREIQLLVTDESFQFSILATGIMEKLVRLAKNGSKLVTSEGKMKTPT